MRYTCGREIAQKIVGILMVDNGVQAVFRANIPGKRELVPIQAGQVCQGCGARLKPSIRERSYCSRECKRADQPFEPRGRRR